LESLVPESTTNNSGFKSQTKAQLDHRNMKEIKDFLIHKDSNTTTNLELAQSLPVKSKKKNKKAISAMMTPIQTTEKKEHIS
jgi:hypothetical protein